MDRTTRDFVMSTLGSTIGLVPVLPDDLALGQDEPTMSWQLASDGTRVWVQGIEERGRPALRLTKGQPERVADQPRTFIITGADAVRSVASVVAKQGDRGGII